MLEAKQQDKPRTGMEDDLIESSFANMKRRGEGREERMDAKAQPEGSPLMMTMIIMLSNIIRSYFYYVVAQSTGQAAHCAQMAVWPVRHSSQLSIQSII